MKNSSMPSLKVLQVIDMLNAGGAERVMVDLSNILNKNGVDISVLTIVKPGILADSLNKDIKFFNLERNFKYSLFKMYEFYKIAKEFDIVHVHMRYNLKYVWLIKKIFKLKSKIIFHDHYGQIEMNQGVDYFLKKAMLDTSYLGVSQQLCKWAQKVNSNCQTYSLYNTIVKKYFNPKNKLETNKKHFLLVSNFRKQKNIEFSIDIIEILSKSTNIKFDIYGQKADANYFDKIESIIKAKNLTKHIKIIHNSTDIQAILPNYNLALHVATSETGPLVLLEYISQGLPFLTYHTGEVVEQIIDEFPEFIIDDFNLNRWVVQIDKILELDSTLLHKNLIAFFEANYSEKEYFNQCMKIYKNVLNS